MSVQTIANIHKAIQEHIDDISKDNESRILNDWCVGYATIQSDSSTTEGISYTVGYVTSENSTPQSVMGVMALAGKRVEMDLQCGFWGTPDNDAE